MSAPIILLLKSLVAGYHRKDGTYVKPHNRKGGAAAKPGAGQLSLFTAPSTPEPAQKAPKKPGFSADAPVDDYRLDPQQYDTWAYVLPGVGRSFSDEQKRAMAQWFKDAGWNAKINDKGRVVVFTSGSGDGAKLNDIPVSPAQKRRAEKASAAAEASQKADAEKQDRARAVQSTDAFSFVDRLLGDEANTFNKRALANYLNGESKHFDGIAGSGWADKLKQAGVKVGDGSPKAMAEGIKTAFAKPEPRVLLTKPAKVVEPENEHDKALLDGEISIEDYISRMGLPADHFDDFAVFDRINKEAEKEAVKNTDYHKGIAEIGAALDDLRSKLKNGSTPQQRKAYETNIAKYARAMDHLKNVIARNYEHPFDNRFVTKLPNNIRARFESRWNSIKTGDVAKRKYYDAVHGAKAKLIIAEAKKLIASTPSEKLNPAKDLDGLIKIAADSIEKLRKDDVYRVLDQNADNRDALAQYISQKRPDLAQEVAEVMREEFGV